MRGNSSRPSGTMEMPSRTISSAPIWWIAFPLYSMAPRLGFNRPVIVRRMVDLPAPLEPTMVTISPARTSRLACHRAWMLP